MFFVARDACYAIVGLAGEEHDLVVSHTWFGVDAEALLLGFQAVLFDFARPERFVLVSQSRIYRRIFVGHSPATMLQAGGVLPTEYSSSSHL